MPGGLPGCLFLRPTSIVGGWWKYMCKVFLGEIAIVYRGLAICTGVWGLTGFGWGGACWFSTHPPSFDKLRTGG